MTAAARVPREVGTIMQAESVLAIRAGAKLQTRRVVDGGTVGRLELAIAAGLIGDEAACRAALLPACPYGEPGGRLWVREAWAAAETCKPPACLRYRLIGNVCADHRVVTYRADGAGRGRWESPMFMRRADARLVLTITEVRIERLHEITEADAQAEGVPRPTCPHPDCTPGGCASSRFRPEFAVRWDRLNAKRKGGIYAWARNPWVWAITFTRTETT